MAADARQSLDNAYSGLCTSSYWWCVGERTSPWPQTAHVMHAAGLRPNDTRRKRKMVAGLRNLRAHGFIEDDPERELEFIAFASLLAKLLDGAAT